MGLIDDIAAHLGTGRVLYTRARGTRFTAHVAGGMLVVESDRSGRKVLSPATVEVASRAIEANAPPMEDRAAQVARSWVGSIQDSMRGAANAAPRGKAKSANASIGAKARSAPTSSKRSATRGQAPSPARAPKSAKPAASTRAPRKAPARRPAARVPRPVQEPSPRTDPVNVAREIGLEIAKAIAQGQRPPPEQIESVVLAQIQAQVAAANEELDRVRAALDAAVVRSDDEVARAEAAERQAVAWKSVASGIPLIGTVAVAPARAPGGGAEPTAIAELLRDAARSWKTAPSGAIASCRTALEHVMRDVAARLPGGDAYRREPFAEVHRFLAANVGAPRNLADADLFLAKDLYRRSSKAGHGETGWKATPLEALLLIAGVSAIASRAGLAA